MSLSPTQLSGLSKDSIEAHKMNHYVHGIEIMASTYDRKRKMVDRTPDPVTKHDPKSKTSSFTNSKKNNIEKKGHEKGTKNATSSSKLRSSRSELVDKKVIIVRAGSITTDKNENKTDKESENKFDKQSQKMDEKKEKKSKKINLSQNRKTKFRNKNSCKTPGLGIYFKMNMRLDSALNLKLLSAEKHQKLSKISHNDSNLNDLEDLFYSFYS